MVIFVMTKCCGTCGRWVTGRQIGRDLFLGGKCTLDDRERHAREMPGCLGWKKPTPEQLDQRVQLELIDSTMIGGN